MGTTNILDLNNRVSALEKAVSGGDSAQANKKDIATEFSATTAYTAGCFVYYGGKLYQFNTDHAAGAWDSTDVVEANVTDQIVSNKAAIDGLTASDVAYDNTDSGLTATSVQGAVDDIAASMGNMRMIKLWENPNPTASFAAQDITLSSNVYDILLIIGVNSSSSGVTIAAIVQKGKNGRLSYLLSSSAYIRNINYSSNTVYAVQAGYAGATENNDVAIPLTIYGITLT